jgi:hypothetical protein
MPTSRISGRKGLTGLSGGIDSPRSMNPQLTHSPQQLSKSLSSPLLSQSATYKKPLTHKLVYSYDDELKGLDHSNDRNIDITANWSGTKFFNRKFLSSYDDSYKNPKTIKSEYDLFDDNELAQFNKQKAEEEKTLYKEALKNLNNKIYTGFGSIDNMNRALKKRNGEGMLLYEFKEFLGLKNCDIKDDELNIIFKVLDTNGEGILKTDSIVRSLALQENEDNHKNQEHDEMRAFLQEQLDKRRNSKSKPENDFNSQRSNTSKGSDHLKEVQKALKQNTFGLDVAADEFNELIEESFTKKHTQQSHNRFARFLRLTNVRLDRIPFYDMRNDQLLRLKERAGNLQTVSDDINERLKELDEIRKEKDAIVARSTKSISKSSNPLQELASPVNKINNYGDDNSTIDSDYDNSQSSYMLSPSSQLKSPTNADVKDFFPKVLDPLTRPKLKDAGSVLIMSNNDQLVAGSLSPSPPRTIGKRIVPQDFADYSRYGLTMDDDNASVGSQSSQDRYTSTYKSYYPPVYYESSQPPVRDLESDADKSVKSKNKIRAERFNRKQANLDVTFSRLEYESVKKEAQEICRTQNRNEDRIRYQTSIFLNDMKHYRKQPLETMAKKPNLHLSDNMWGGHQKVDHQDDRTFQSTYNAGFNSSILHGSPQTSQKNHQTLKLLRQQQNIFAVR